MWIRARVFGSSSGEEWRKEEESETTVLNALPPAKKEMREYVAIQYNGSIFAGVITKAQQNGAEVKDMIQKGNLSKWPEREEMLFYEWSNVLWKAT